MITPGIAPVPMSSRPSAAVAVAVGGELIPTNIHRAGAVVVAMAVHADFVLIAVGAVIAVPVLEPVTAP